MFGTACLTVMMWVSVGITGADTPLWVSLDLINLKTLRFLVKSQVSPQSMGSVQISQKSNWAWKWKSQKCTKVVLGSYSCMVKSFISQS